MMKTWIRQLLLSPLIFICGCNYYDGIPVIGRDLNSEAIQVFVPVEQYSVRLKTVVTHVSDSALPVLEQHQAQPRSKSRWALRLISFGVGVQSEMGIGPFKVGAAPAIKLVFSNYQSK
jgi:hypothetical protein